MLGRALNNHQGNGHVNADSEASTEHRGGRICYQLRWRYARRAHGIGHLYYMVASRGVMGWSSGGAQKAKAFEEADAYCRGLGKALQPIRSNETPGGFGQIASGEVEFRCLNPDDPALHQPAFGPTAAPIR
jgi:hypothetical protein